MALDPLASVFTSVGNVAEPETDNTPAVIVFPVPERNFRHHLAFVAWSYDAPPTNGRLVVHDGASRIFTVPITSAGPGGYQFANPLRCQKESQLTVTLEAGGAGVKGTLNAYKFTRKNS